MDALPPVNFKSAHGTLMSTITGEVSTVQGFASSSTLGIIVDLVTILFMVGLMFWLDWDFTLIAIGLTPFLLMFVVRFKKAVKEATREVRFKQSEVLAVVQEGLGSVRAVKAFGREDLEIGHMDRVAFKAIRP
ncbi:MAG TPA: ABC transporter transmembrane domain-containing protein [Chromatiaceae bacterium]|nr:ABC transporter transmembrane domain-containing protein [Chromatiaceae bacterium]